jgi:hypothetical protein
MKQPELKDFIRNSAEKPIRICLTDGPKYLVSHPDFAFTTSDSLIVASGPGHEFGAEFVVCPISHISRVEVLKRNGKALRKPLS